MIVLFDVLCLKFDCYYVNRKPSGGSSGRATGMKLGGKSKDVDSFVKQITAEGRGGWAIFGIVLSWLRHRCAKFNCQDHQEYHGNITVIVTATTTTKVIVG